VPTTFPDRPRIARPLWRALRPLARPYLWLAGWRLEGEFPDAPKMVIVAAPHTSNWDYIYLLAAGLVWDAPFAFFAKDELFRWPLGVLLRWLGGVPVDRSQTTGVALWATRQLEQMDHLYLVIPPEGTRSRADYWNSGFYWIALAANVPIALAYADYARRVVGIGPVVELTGQPEADMAAVSEFYAGVTAKFPGQVGPVAFPPRRQRVS
jgi:1-acyl-sn-glycerol-3-phosphate acyltransferase